MVEIVTEHALAHRLLKVFVGRGNDAHIDGDRLACRRRARTRAPGESATAWFATRAAISPTSSRNSVPPSAISNLPFFCRCAPVKAPRSWPNSSLSSRSREKPAQLIATNGLGRAIAPLVNRAGENFLAGAALAEQQHGGPASGGFSGLLSGRFINALAPITRR